MNEEFQKIIDAEREKHPEAAKALEHMLIGGGDIESSSRPNFRLINLLEDKIAERFQKIVKAEEAEPDWNHAWNTSVRELALSRDGIERNMGEFYNLPKLGAVLNELQFHDDPDFFLTYCWNCMTVSARTRVTVLKKDTTWSFKFNVFFTTTLETRFSFRTNENVTTPWRNYKDSSFCDTACRLEIAGEIRPYKRKVSWGFEREFVLTVEETMIKSNYIQLLREVKEVARIDKRNIVSGACEDYLKNLRGSVDMPPELKGKVTNAVTEFCDNYIDLVNSNIRNADDYYHCKTNFDALMRGMKPALGAIILGFAKETVDIFDNYFRKGLTVEETIEDGRKDISANFTGLKQAALAKLGFEDFKNASKACEQFIVNGFEKEWW